MKILLFHPVKLPVTHYGGTERALMWLVNTLHAQGHQVSVFAAPGSSMPQGVGCITDIEELRKKASSFDIMHGFTKLDREWEERLDGKILITIQGNGQKGERFHRNTVFVSQNHAERHGAREFVYNGLNPDELSYREGSRPNRYLFLSKTSWKVKNLKGAVRYTQRAKQNLWIAGGEQPYFLKAQVLLRGMMGRDWKWVGSVNQKQKAEFLIQGKAMVFPLLWNEPFGIVMTESLVSGTPVLAHPFGSVPEILEFAPQCLMKSDSDWDLALRGEVQLPSAKQCRDWVLAKFDQKAMTKKYLELYERVASGKSIHEVEPETKILAEEITQVNS